MNNYSCVPFVWFPALQPSCLLRHHPSTSSSPYIQMWTILYRPFSNAHLFTDMSCSPPLPLSPHMPPPSPAYRHSASVLLMSYRWLNSQQHWHHTLLNKKGSLGQWGSGAFIQVFSPPSQCVHLQRDEFFSVQRNALCTRTKITHL